MAYKALYRTYRPKDFEEIAGQEHITRTFKNALKNNKIAHAYLFSGPRGTGKTSIAKIIAKAVNCIHAPISNPCNECDVCKGIDNNTISDVIEIDAASNNGVDEIREIRDKVKYLPGVGKYKVYIIDEVHMLSQGAFNALLKTLEEPPKHVIFILATTEPHKIPATIHSRCQRFDFRGVSVPEMITRMGTIVKEESIDINKEAVKVIAEAAEGGMRDAISLLDQVVSYTDKEVQVDDVHAIRGTVSNEKLLEIAQAIYENDSVKAIKLLDELVALGKEAQRLVENLIKFYRDLLIYKNTNVSESDQLLYLNQDFRELSSKLSNNLVFYYIDVLNKAQTDMKYTNNAKLYMELALIKMVDKVEKQEIIVEDELTSIKEQLEYLKEELKNRPMEVVQTKQMENTVEDIIIHVEPTVEETVVVEESQETPQQEESHESTQQNVDVFATQEEKQEDYPSTTFNNEVKYEEPVQETTLKPEVTQDVDTQEKVEEGAKKLDEPQPEKEDLFSIEAEVIKEEPYTTYDIRIVEEVLNNGDRKVKILINKNWFDIERAVNPLDLDYAKLITNGRVVATDGKTLIISYPSALTCNRMMETEIKEKVKRLLSDFHGMDLDYMALPTEAWEKVSDEFLKEWKIDKNRRIKLTPISHPGLRDIKIRPTQEKMDDFTPDSVKDAYNLFGRENVKVRKGD